MCINKIFGFLEFSILMEKKEKVYTKLKLATCFRKILKEKKVIDQNNKERGIEDITLVDTMRQLEAASGLSFTLIQTAAAGKRDPQFTSIITLIESLNMTFSEFAILYDNLTDTDIKEAKKEIEQNKKGTIKKKNK